MTCFFGHKWSIWSNVRISEYAYHQTRYCLKCRKGEIREV